MDYFLLSFSLPLKSWNSIKNNSIRSENSANGTNAQNTVKVYIIFQDGHFQYIVAITKPKPSFAIFCYREEFQMQNLKQFVRKYALVIKILYLVSLFESNDMVSILISTDTGRIWNINMWIVLRMYSDFSLFKDQRLKSILMEFCSTGLTLFLVQAASKSLQNSKI